MKKNKSREGKIHSFSRIPEDVLLQAAININTYRGETDKPLDHNMVVTAFKSQITPQSAVSGVPRVEWFMGKPTFRIPLRGTKYPAFASMELIESLL